jgi:acetoin utilization deacetylase AcuC-like enzyme
MRAYTTAHCSLELPEHHPFPRYKYRAVAEALAQDFDLVPAPPASWEALGRVHAPEYLRKLQDEGLSRPEYLRLGLPWSPSLLERALCSTGGTLEATRDALKEGLGLNLSGGTHHAYPDHAEGYCLFNDVAVAIAWLRDQGFGGRILVIDLDAHQGNGSAVCLKDDPNVYTLSIHAERNYPLKKEQSSFDLGLPDGTEDQAYLEALEQALDRGFAFRPELIFYNAGVDVLAGDRFGRLALSLEGVAERDRRVFARVRHAELPLVVVMGGGYNRDPAKVVAAHSQTYRLAAQSLV